MNLWIVNPFDDLPWEAGRPMRYGSACRALSAAGHRVTWWSSDFHHRSKRRRSPDAGLPSPPTMKGAHHGTLYDHPEGFRIHLIPTPPYARNIGVARLRNHAAFARGWEQAAMEGVASGEHKKPDRIWVSLPPLDTAGCAYRLGRVWNVPVALDIQDAWPDTFLRLLPGPGFFQRVIGRVLFAPWFRQARLAYRRAERITACAQSYLDLAAAQGARCPMHRWYHGTWEFPDLGHRQHPGAFEAGNPLRLVYVGNLASTFDLETAIGAVSNLRNEGHPVELHLAGVGEDERGLRALADSLAPPGSPSVAPGSPDSERAVIFHGFLSGHALTALLVGCHAGLILSHPDSRVQIPIKLVDYCAAGLPVISSLTGECASVLGQAGCRRLYRFGDVASLTRELRHCLHDPGALRNESGRVRTVGETLFSNARNLPPLCEFLLEGKLKC